MATELRDSDTANMSPAAPILSSAAVIRSSGVKTFGSGTEILS